MKVYIVIAGKNDVVYRGSWHGCLNHCSNHPNTLRIAVFRAGEPTGRVILEALNGKLRQPTIKATIPAKSLK